MISALKKLTSPQGRLQQDGNHHPSPPPPGKPDPTSNGIHALPDALQKKFSRGVHYNLKLLLRGDRSSGKSALFHRLQGKPFLEAYEATEEIQVASIQWNHKATDDIVKVEVWDVVDKGKKRIKLEGLKLKQDNKNTGSDQSTTDALDASLDAEFVDVYKGAHGAVFLFDVTKQWTFDYVIREVDKVPVHIPVLVLGNFMDQRQYRCITRDQALSFVESASVGAKVVRYSESSMRNGFGLRFLHKFLSLPYLALQREALRRQVEANAREFDAMTQELDLYFQSEESDYDSFAEGMGKKRRQQADQLAPAPTIDVVLGGGGTIKEKQESVSVPPTPQQPIQQPILTTSSKDDKPIITEKGEQAMEEFVPEANAIDFFLNENDQTDAVNGKGAAPDEDSDDEDTGNPMVASFKEDIDLEELDKVAKIDYEEL